MRMFMMAAAAVCLAVSAEASDTETRSFDIAAQAAADALNDWGRQAGVQLLFPYDAVSGRRSAGLKGAFTSREALRRLLAEQPLEIASDDGQTIALRAVGVQDVAGIDEIMVTAQRRAERQLDVPVSMTAFSADAVAAYRLETLQDVSRLSPNFLVSSFSPGRPVISIRGASNTFNQIGVDKPVGVFVDDVFISRNSAQTLELFGIESIQVLRGPQGTLFGRNVTGGAVVVETGRPDYGSSRFAVRASLGEHATRDIDALADLALADQAAVRVAGMVRRHNGWGRDRLTGGRLDDQDSWGVRAQLRLRLSDAAELLVGGDYASDDSGGRTLSSIGVGDDGDRRTAELGVPQAFARTQGGVSARLFYTADVGEVVSVTALRKSKTRDVFSNVGANYRFLAATQSQALSDDRDDVRTFTQEIRYVSPAWSWGSLVAGAFYLDEDAARELASTALAGVTGNLVTSQLADQSVATRSYAVFADATVTLASTLSVSFGGRNTWDTKRAALTRTDALNVANAFSESGLESKWSEFTPRAVVKFQPDRDLLVYASFSRGYTAGGYNTEAATLAALRTPFAPETLTNYETGVNGAWLDGRLRVNVSAFSMKYRNKQELFFNNVTRVLNITNAARATMRGVETQVSAQASDWLTLSATYGLLDTRYDDFVIPGGADNTGNRLGSSPRHKVSAVADVSYPLGGGRVFGNVAVSRTSSYFTGAAADPGLFINGYALVNGAVGYATAGDRFTVSAYVRNAFDQDYVLIPSVQTIRAEYLGAPRIVGATFAANF